MLLKLAWRNIWRNKRRTFITAASVLFAVFLSIFMRSIQQGAWDNMLDNVVNFYFGYAQVHTKGFNEEQTINKAFVMDEALPKLKNIPSLKGIVPRLESFALAAKGDATRGVLAIGIDPEQENAMTKLSERLVEGRYLDADDKAVLISTGVGKYLNLGVRDSIILISQGYHGVNAAGKYPIKGLVKFASPDLNKRMVYLPMKEAQWFYGADHLVTSLVLDIDGKKNIPAVLQKAKTQLDTTKYEILDWQEMIPEIVEAKDLDTAGSLMILLLLYLIVGFGIFGTILMMTQERLYEFGILMSIGMKRVHLAIVLWLEILFVGLIGAIAGMLVAYPVVQYFAIHPIDLSSMGEGAKETYEKFGMEPIIPALVEPSIFIEQAVVIFLIALVVGFYPLLKIARLKPIEAMKQ